MKTGEKIRQLRLAKRMTQAELAENIGVSKGHLGEYERGRWVGEKSLSKLASYFGVTETYLSLDSYDYPPMDCDRTSEPSFTFLGDTARWKDITPSLEYRFVIRRGEYQVDVYHRGKYLGTERRTLKRKDTDTFALADELNRRIGKAIDDWRDAF